MTGKRPACTVLQRPDPTERFGSSVTYAGLAYDLVASVAITVAEGVAIAFVYDPHGTDVWLHGTASGGQLTLTAAGVDPTEPAGPHLIGTVAGDVAAGTVTAGPRRWPFGIKQVGPPSGLYRIEETLDGTPIAATWIVLADGAQVGVLETGGSRRPAPWLELPAATTTVDGRAVRASRVEGVAGRPFPTAL